ncbi:MAG: hypothetical protein ACHQEB_05895 [Chitinophagales bacterium]
MKQVFFSIIVLLFISLLQQALNAQTSYEQFYLKRENFENNLTELKKEFGNKKIIPRELELECLVALSFYPELKNTDIEFRFGKLNFTMISKPKFSSILKNKSQRQYSIIIQEPGFSKNNLEWKELSFNALVGWIGHELGHVLHYSHKSSGGILFIGMKYAFPGYRKKMERFTDQLAIQHELGYALYEGVDYTINCSGATAHYKNNQEKFYLHADEIIERINSKQNWLTVFRKTKMKYQTEIISRIQQVQF